jgi:flagellar biosynthesis protein FlhG
VREFLDISDEILAVTTTDPSAITDLYALIKMLHNSKQKLLITFNHTKKYVVGEKITNSLKALMRKNNLNNNFILKYIGNISTNQNVQPTSRLRKLFAKEFPYDDTTLDMNNILNFLI